ncbi:MAG: hypothetical protein KIT09_20845 [Bryobacteraceae bacterium]|nr:hypothetical protein [Bryobacteraceae bacterium]
MKLKPAGAALGAVLEMMLRLVIAGFLYLSAGSAEPASARLVGTIKKLAGNQLEIAVGTKAVKVYADRAVEVHKDRTDRTLSSLKVGDEVSVSFRRGDSGRLVAIAIWANLVTFRAVIHSVTPACFDILTHQDADPQSAYQKGYRRVFVYPQTKFSTSERDLIEGRDVHVVGLDVGGGNVDALRVAIYNTDVPVEGRQR